MRWFAVLIVMMLAGCSGSPETVDDQETPEAETPDAGAEAPEAEAPSTNLTFLPTLSLDVVNGTAPLLVNISIDAPGFQDVAWTLSVNDEQLDAGTTLPATSNATLDAGNHTIRLDAIWNGTAESLEEVVTVHEGIEPLRDLATGFTIEGKFDTGTTPLDSASHEFEVPEGVYAISAWVTWWSGHSISDGIVVTDIDTTMNGPNGEVASSGGGGYEWLNVRKEEPLTPGTYSINLDAFATVAETGYTIDVLFFHAVPTVFEFEGTFGPSVADATGGLASHEHPVTGPVHAVAGYLIWGVPDEPSCGTANAKGSDPDLVVKGTSTLFSSGTFASCEYGHADSDLGAFLPVDGTITVDVNPWFTPPTEYHFTGWYV